MTCLIKSFGGATTASLRAPSRPIQTRTHPSPYLLINAGERRRVELERGGHRKSFVLYTLNAHTQLGTTSTVRLLRVTVIWLVLQSYANCRLEFHSCRIEIFFNQHKPSMQIHSHLV